MRVLRLLAGNLAVFLALLLVVLVAAEVWARARPRNWFVIYDSLLGVRLKPGAEGVYRGLSFFRPNPGIDTPVHINTQGMRGPQRTIPGDGRVWAVPNLTMSENYSGGWLGCRWARTPVHQRSGKGGASLSVAGASGSNTLAM